MRGLEKRYGAVAALVGVTLSVGAGTVAALVGPNGSGKSTLLAIAAGVVAADAGEALVCGARAGTMPAARSAAYAPDDPAGLDELTVSELLALLGVLHGSPADVGPRRAELVERFALAPLADRRLAELSRGQRRRASLVAALQLSAPLILVDEATATLDTAAVAALRVTLLEAAAHGAGVLVAAHDHAFVAGIADVVLELRRGALVPAGGRGCRREPALV